MGKGGGNVTRGNLSRYCVSRCISRRSPLCELELAAKLVVERAKGSEALTLPGIGLRMNVPRREPEISIGQSSKL